MEKKLNLATGFDENTHDYFVSTDDAEAWLEQQKMLLANTNDPFEQMGLYGRIGGALRILKRLDEAEAFLDQALELIEVHKFHKKHWVQQIIRRAHVAQWKTQFGKAEEMLNSALHETRTNGECRTLEHFVLQHLGKCFLDKREYTTALQHLESALQIRKSLGDASLIKSTEDAIANAKQKLS